MKLLLVLLLIVSILECKKKSASKQTNKRPATIEPELYCNSCQAILKEVFKKIRDSRKESDVR